MPNLESKSTHELQVDLKAAQEFLALQTVKPARTVRRARQITKELASRAVEPLSLTRSSKAKSNPIIPGISAGLAKDLVGYAGDQPLRIVGTRATWDTVKLSKTGRTVLVEGTIAKYVDPATPMERVSAQ